MQTIYSAVVQELLNRFPETKLLAVVMVMVVPPDDDDVAPVIRVGITIIRVVVGRILIDRRRIDEDAPTIKSATMPSTSPVPATMPTSPVPASMTVSQGRGRESQAHQPNDTHQQRVA